MPNGAIQLVRRREDIHELLKHKKLIDVVIPRGSNQLVRDIQENANGIPVLGHADGICSIYIHADADREMAAKVLLDAKLGYPAACNAVETLLVDEAALNTVLPTVAITLLENGTTLRCDKLSKEALTANLSSAQATILQDASDDDFDTEFLSPILAIKTIPSQPSPIKSVSLAVAHVNAHSSKHTDGILTRSSDIARYFQDSVDGAVVIWNASTRMNDGYRFGFGTEVGVSTNKIHARGPVGLEGLTIYKDYVNGNGHTASEYHDGAGGKSWKHEKLL